MDTDKALAVVRNPDMVLVLGHQLLDETIGVRQAPAPTRAQLAIELCQRLGESVKGRGLDVLFTEYETRFGRHGMISFLRDRLQYFGSAPPVWTALASWPVAGVVNFSWIDLYGDGCRNSNLSRNIAVEADDLQYLREELRSEVHLRGLLSRSHSMVLTLPDFYRATSYDHTQWHIWEYAANMLRARPVLMLGMDYDEVVLLNQYLINRFDVTSGQELIVSRADCWQDSEVQLVQDCSMQILLLADTVTEFVFRTTRTRD